MLTATHVQTAGVRRRTEPHDVSFVSFIINYSLRFRRYPACDANALLLFIHSVYICVSLRVIHATALRSTFH